jgi:photosystem II stability/assembly factor-like uncharacterized protein
MSEVRIQKSEFSRGFFSVPLCLCGVILFLAANASAQWVKQTVNTTASLRGLAVVNEKVVWASGTGGTVIRTIDGGKTWKVMTVPGAERLDFRDIEAFDANTAYILSIGNGELSRIYKTTNGGKIWKLEFKNTNEKAFFDAIACWDNESCIAVSDPVDGKYVFIRNFWGEKWSVVESPGPAVAREGQAAFAASGTCLITTGVHHPAMLVTGGTAAEVIVTRDNGVWWDSFKTPIISGTAGSGIFSIAMWAPNGVIVGGNYEKPDEAKDNLAFTVDGGKTWKLGTGLTGYRSGVKYVDKQTIIAVGTNGSDISRDGGTTWKILGKENLNAVQAMGKRAVWAVGPKGVVVKMK